MAKDRRFQVRINRQLLDEFDDCVGFGNRSKVINRLIEIEVFKFKRKGLKVWHNRR